MCKRKSPDGQESVAEERRIALRIGVNLGDVVVEDDDLLGDGVNVAARLEQLCPPGGVLISGSAYDHLSGKLDVRFEYAGEQRLKNIARPVRTYQMVLAGSPSPLAPSVRADKPAVAVLPFENMSGDPEQTYFSDGMTEDVITELSRFRELTVIARNSTFSFRGQSVDVRDVGRSLGAGYVVEGSVRRAGDRVRITAQLVDAANGLHLWAEKYDRAVEDVFAIQEEIAQSIVATVAQRVKEDSEIAARRRPPEDIRAYDLFLQAHRLSDVFTPEAQERVQALYEQALQIDPTFARAYTGLAFSHLTRAFDAVGGPVEQDEDRVKALRLAEQALALDPNDPRVHATLGYMCLIWRDFDRAEHHLDLAKAMNPNDPTILMYWAWMQGCIGRPERALAVAEIAFKLNPRYPGWYNALLARILFQLGRYDEAALIFFEKLTSDDPGRHPRDMAWRAAAYGHLGRIEEAQQCGELVIQSLRSLWRGDPTAGPEDYVDWIIDRSFLRQPEDVEHLREGLRLAGLPA